MKKTLLLTSVALLMGAMNADAQVVKLYKSGQLVTSYESSEVDSVVFENEHEYVDLGLPSGTLWAKTNVGADTETDAGLYFACGETVGYGSDTSDGRSFDWASLIYCSGTTSDGPFTKYVTDSSYGTVDDKIELESSNDAATANWGSDWCMPTETDMMELINNTENSWTTINDVSGYKFVNKSDHNKYIFLPAAGCRNINTLSVAGSDGNYWSRSCCSYINNYACYLDFRSNHLGTQIYYRNYGRSIRPVRSSAK